MSARRYGSVLDLIDVRVLAFLRWIIPILFNTCTTFIANGLDVAAIKGVLKFGFHKFRLNLELQLVIL